MTTFSEKYFMSIPLFIITLLIIGLIIMFTESRLTGAIITLTATGFLIILLLIIFYESFNNNLSSIKVKVDIETPVVLEDGDETDTHSIDSHNDVFISDIEHV